MTLMEHQPEPWRPTGRPTVREQTLRVLTGDRKGRKCLRVPAPGTWKQADQAAPDRKWRRLKTHKLWDDIEIRLRHRWSPRKVESWLKTEYPKVLPVSFKTLYRYLHNKPEGWFVSELVIAGASKVTHSRVSRLLVLEEHAAALELLKERINEARL
jgi:hypothetical protein